MRTAGFWPPEILTRPTPGNCEILGARRVSARSSTFDSEIFSDVSANVKIGVSAGFVLLYIGGVGRSGGRYVPEALMEACTSCSATSMFNASVNCSVITELPSELMDVICC